MSAESGLCFHRRAGKDSLGTNYFKAEIVRLLKNGVEVFKDIDGAILIAHRLGDVEFLKVLMESKNGEQQ